MSHTDQQISPDPEGLILSPAENPDVPMHEKMQNPLLAQAFPGIFPSSDKGCRQYKFAALDMNRSKLKKSNIYAKRSKLAPDAGPTTSDLGLWIAQGGSRSSS